MKGDFHVRFCERLKLKCFGLLDHSAIACTSAILFRKVAMPSHRKNPFVAIATPGLFLPHIATLRCDLLVNLSECIIV